MKYLDLNGLTTFWNKAYQKIDDLKLDVLVSGSNIKTIDGVSILGSGDVSIEGTLVMTVDEMINFNPIANEGSSYLAGFLDKSSRYVVTKEVDGVPVNVGILEILSDSSQHVYTQVFTTHFALDNSGNLDLGSHTDTKLVTYFRSYSIDSPLIDSGTWTKWKDISHYSDIQESIAKNKQDIEFLNANTGISEYPEFSEAKAYAVGDVVLYEGLLKRFTSAHEPGTWDGSQVEAWSERKEVDRKLTKLSGKISGLFGGDIHIPLPSSVVGEFWSQVGDTISYGDSPAPCRYQPIDVSEYIGKNATITIRWNSTPEPPSWLYLLFFKPTNYPRNDGKGFVMEADCYNAATNGQYTFDVEILDRYLYLSKRYEFTEISINIKDNGEIESIVAESVEKVVKGNYGYNGQDLSWNWGYLSANGGLTETSESNGRKYTDLTPCIGGSMVRYRGETDHSAIAGIAFYNSEGNVISAEVNVGNINEEHTAIVPKGAAFFRLSINLSYQSEDSVYVRFDKSIVDVAMSAYALAYASANKGEVAYVAPNGSDANDGASQDTAYATIQRAIDGGASVIYVVPGTYTSSFAIRNKDSVTIMPIGYGEYSHATPNTPKIVIDGNKTREYGILAHDCKQLRMIGVEFANFTRSVAQIKNVDDLYFLDCIVRDNELYNGFQLTNVNGVLENCSAINIYDDGFNIHGYGCTHFINCTALNCHDDGISHHDGCTGFIEGGEYSGSGKAGIAPAYGANVNIANVVCKNNVIGIGYLTTENGHARMKGIVSNALLVGNTTGLKVDELCDVIAYNNKYKNNEQDKVLLGNVEDYDL